MKSLNPAPLEPPKFPNPAHLESPKFPNPARFEGAGMQARGWQGSGARPVSCPAAGGDIFGDIPALSGLRCGERPHGVSADRDMRGPARNTERSPGAPQGTRPLSLSPLCFSLPGGFQGMLQVPPSLRTGIPEAWKTPNPPARRSSRALSLALGSSTHQAGAFQELWIEGKKTSKIPRRLPLLCTAALGIWR